MNKYKGAKIILFEEEKEIVLNCDNLFDSKTGEKLENSSLLTSSLLSDVGVYFDEIEEQVNAFLLVVTGEVKEETGWGGNCNSINVYPDYTYIEDGYEDADEEIICKIETIEFIKLILVWAEAVFENDRRWNVINDNSLNFYLDWINRKWYEIEAFEKEKKEEKK